MNASHWERMTLLLEKTPSSYAETIECLAG
jgi:hypothetical protein